MLAARDRASATENLPGVAPTVAAAAALAKLPVLFLETKAGLSSLDRLDGVVERESDKVDEAIELGRLLVDMEDATLSRSNGGSDPLTAEAAERAALWATVFTATENTSDEEVGNPDGSANDAGEEVEPGREGEW